MAIQDHPKYSNLMTRVNTLISKIHDGQILYFAANAKYFQGIRIPDTDCDGETNVIIDSSLRPHDQAESWNDFDSITFTTNTKIPINITIDVYKAPSGWGWVLTVELWYAGLDPDEYGHRGTHWIYRHQEGLSNPGTWDTWLVMDDTIDGGI